MVRHRVQIAPQLAVAILFPVIALNVAASHSVEVQSAPPASPRSAAASYQHAVKQLTEEARQSWEQQKLVRSEKTFASEFTAPLPAEFLAQKLARRLHEHPFHDAYIRWQLSGLAAAAVPESPNDRQFLILLSNLPRLLENPRAERGTINALVKTTDSGELGVVQQERATKQLADIAVKADQVTALNKPSLELRDWIAKQVATNRQRSLMAGIERCAALVDAGWPSDEAKTQLDEQFTAAADDATFSRSQRQSIVALLQPLAGRQRVMIVHAAVQDKRVVAQYADTAILDFDVRRWCRLIQLE